MFELFTGIEHAAIAARDTTALSAFYRDSVGFQIKHTMDPGGGKQKAYFICLGLNFIEIMPSARETPPRENMDKGLSHLAILVSDFDRAVARVNASGAKQDGPERAGPGGARIQFYFDPEGNLFHLLWRPSPL